MRPHVKFDAPRRAVKAMATKARRSKPEGGASVHSFVGRERLDGQGGGPHDPGMEQRVAKLEADVGEIKDLLGKQVMPLLIRIDERLNGQDTRLGRYEVTGDRLEAKVDRLDESQRGVTERLGGIEGRQDRLEAKVDRLDESQRGGTERLGGIEGRQDRLETKFDRLEAKFDRMEEALHRQELGIAEIKGRVSQLPTTIQLLGFVIAILVASGLIKHFIG